MKLAAIIAEYNPFHNGHEYMIKKIKKELHADYIVAVMSGDFTQRGIPGIADKYARAKMAVSCGVDAVFELPVRFATASAEGFATGAVSFFDALSCVDYLVFGSENGTLEDFSEAISLLDNTPETFRDSIRMFQKQGHSYPKAFSMAVAASGQTIKLSTSLLSSPNNLLGLEYMKALDAIGSSIRPYTILRTGTGYHDLHTTFSEDSDSMIASASAIRNMLGTSTGTIASAQPAMPETAYRIFADSYGITTPILPDDFSLLLSYQLSRETKNTLTKYIDMSEDLADRILKSQDTYMTFTERIQAAKHKQYTYARINRALLHVLLGLRNNDVSATNHTPYARLLAMKKTASPLMKKIKESSKIPVITKAADAKKLLSAEALSLFEEDIFAANLYSGVVADKFHSAYLDDIRHGIIIVE